MTAIKDFRQDAMDYLRDKYSKSDGEGNEPTIRVCIKFLNESSREFISHVSPRSIVIKDNLKLPLLVVTFSTGISSAISQAVFKFHGEIMQSGELGILSPFELMLMTAGILNSIMTLVLLNVGI